MYFAKVTKRMQNYMAQLDLIEVNLIEILGLNSLHASIYRDIAVPRYRPRIVVP